MNKLEKGMYVRTNLGIGRIVELGKTGAGIGRNQGTSYYLSLENISKASHNIIDLIEIGDYVNSRRVNEVGAIQDLYTNKHTAISVEGSETLLTNNDIKEALTKEQYKSQVFRVD